MTKKGYKNSENKNATKKDCEAVILFPSQSLKNVKRIKKDMAKNIGTEDAPVTEPETLSQ